MIRITFIIRRKSFSRKLKMQTRLTRKERLFGGEVAFVDSELDKIFLTLKEKGLSENTIILVTSDHGEVMNPSHGKSKFTAVVYSFMDMDRAL